MKNAMGIGLISATIALAGALTYHVDAASCVVGVYGADASVSVSGWGAPQACRAMVAERPQALYIRETPPTADVLCEFDRNHQHLVVRDRGVFMLLGRSFCAAIARSAP